MTASVETVVTVSFSQRTAKTRKDWPCLGPSYLRWFTIHCCWWMMHPIMMSCSLFVAVDNLLALLCVCQWVWSFTPLASDSLSARIPLWCRSLLSLACVCLSLCSSRRITLDCSCVLSSEPRWRDSQLARDCVERNARLRGLWIANIIILPLLALLP